MSQNPTNFKGAYPPFLLDPNTGGILTIAANFAPGPAAILAVSGTSSSITFTNVSPSLKATTFKITNKGSHGAYIAWGSGSATAVVSSSTPTLYCDYVAQGAILTQDFYLTSGSTGAVDTIAAIQDGGSTNLEITIGYGQ